MSGREVRAAAAPGHLRGSRWRVAGQGCLTGRFFCCGCKAVLYEGCGMRCLKRDAKSEALEAKRRKAISHRDAQHKKRRSSGEGAHEPGEIIANATPTRTARPRATDIDRSRLRKRRHCPWRLGRRMRERAQASRFRRASKICWRRWSRSAFHAAAGRAALVEESDVFGGMLENVGRRITERLRCVNTLLC